MSETSFFASADGHTTACGSLWTVLVQPSFADQAFEAAHLLSRPSGPAFAPGVTATKASSASAPPSEFALSIKEKAAAAAGPTPEKGGEPVTETEQIKAAKCEVVEEIWAKLKPGCFSRADDRELEAVTNLLLSLWLPLFARGTEAVLEGMTKQLTEAIATAGGRVTTYGRSNALVTLFNALPAPIASPSTTSPPLQLSILLRLASLGSSQSDLSLLSPCLMRLPSYLAGWGMTSSPHAASAVAQVASVLEQGGFSEDALALVLPYLRQPGAIADSVAATSIRLALSAPDCYDWEFLETLAPVKGYMESPDGAARAALIKALKTGGIPEAEAALSNDVGLSDAAKEKVAKKAKLLALADLCGKRVGGEVTYEEVKDCLKLSGSIEEDDGMEVEEWVINGIKAKLLTARLHQPTHVIYVTTSTSRTFGAPQWLTLLDRLKSWTASVDNIIGVVESALPTGNRTGSGAERALAEPGKEPKETKTEGREEAKTISASA